LGLYFAAPSISAGRVARSAAPEREVPLAKGIKRGGACLFAHGISSSDAIRATHRGIGRRSGEAALLCRLAENRYGRRP